MLVSDLGEGGAPDVIRLHATAEKLLLQPCPLGLGGADLHRSPSFAELLALPGGHLGYSVGPAQDAVLQVGAEFPH